MSSQSCPSGPRSWGTLELPSARRPCSRVPARRAQPAGGHGGGARPGRRRRGGQRRPPVPRLHDGLGSVPLGHAHSAVVDAVRRQAAQGSNFAYVSTPALELAEELRRAVPCAERLGSVPLRGAVARGAAGPGLHGPAPAAQVRGCVPRRQRDRHRELVSAEPPRVPAGRADLGGPAHERGGRSSRPSTISRRPRPSPLPIGTSSRGSSSSRSTAAPRRGRASSRASGASRRGRGAS
jgi:hypothetical protein